MNPTPKSWRDRVKIHPAAELFPMMPDDELLLLGQDIAENGLREQIAFLAADLGQSEEASPATPVLVDGRNRLAAIELVVKDAEQRTKLIENALTDARVLNGDVDPWAYVASANLRRRHLTAEQKRELVAVLLKERPDRSDRATAKLALVSDKTVGAVRVDLEERAEIPHVKDRADTAGRRQPAHKATKAPVPAAPKSKPSKARQRDIKISGFLQLVHAKPAETLQDMNRGLGDQRDWIAKKASLQERIAIGRAFLANIRVGLDDLSPGGTTVGSIASATPVRVAPVAGRAPSAATDAVRSNVAPARLPRHHLPDRNESNR
jgi:hypothetical protein